MTVKEYMVMMMAIERAAENNLHFNWEKADEIFVVTQDFDLRTLENLRNLIGYGYVETENSCALNPKYLSTNNVARGYYKLKIVGKEAYLFCKDIYTYLPRFAKDKFEYCQKCIVTYNENRKYH